MTLPPAFLRLPIAHRALHDRAQGRPENSRAAIRAAIAAGYGIEIDLQASADGVAMVFHDDDLGRLTGATGPVRARTAAELGAIRLTDAEDGIPTLAEVLEIVAGRVPLLIEIKDQSGEMGDLLEPVFLGTTAIDIAVGNNHSCALLSSGRMKCWGRNHHGQLGQVRSGASCADAANTYCIGDAPTEMGALAQVSFPVSNTVSFIAAGDDFTCALLTNGRIYCFGVNNLGQLGQDRAVANWGGSAGDMTDSTNFLSIQLHPNFNSLPVLGIVGGGRATCAVFQNDALLRNETLCWGGGIGRPAPDTPLAGITAPVNYYGFGSFTNLRSITAGTNNVCVRGTANQVLCWDRDTQGQLGNGGANTDTSSPHGQTLVNAALVTGAGYLNLTTGPTHSCSAVGVNQFKCWGLNSSGQLGNATTTSINSPGPETAQSFD